MRTFRFLVLLLAAGSLASCEEPFELDPRETEPRLVIEGTLTAAPAGSQVLITRSGPLDPPAEGFDRIGDAAVTLQAASGQAWSAAQPEPGRYTFPGLIPAEGETYTLKVSHEGAEYQASSILLPPPRLDSLTYARTEANPMREAGYLVQVHFPPIAPGARYRFELIANGVPVPEYFLYDGSQPGEAAGRFTFRSFAGQQGDSIRIRAIAVDPAVYAYFNQLSALGSSLRPSASAPANPASNFSGGALGYFAAQGISEYAGRIP
ncbi:MAG: DUF4249 domain-containing protein [Bacteroidia bacterium]|nr:DUF4249 domain-containing protein [Bacteroidia bacterium]